ncbi:hypothetical protein KJF94_11470 [Pseudomonas hormoni]|uniref:Uncharacterized protein n=1 Tax=Pseudomonas hormoni TaxID=3093767 RepID=A0ABX8F5C4_9PSED|nr:hypothetical protein [Pseudomonas hormoni]QVW26113.1 hypothetical protein KJF94_11470 [Pseudomonas hormoni]
MIDVAYSCDGNPWLDTPAMALTEYEGGFLLPQLMGALASEFIAAPVTHRSSTRQNKASVLKLCGPILRALKTRFSPL